MNEKLILYNKFLHFYVGVVTIIMPKTIITLELKKFVLHTNIANLCTLIFDFMEHVVYMAQEKLHRYFE